MSHPPDEILGAFVEGTLPRGELATVKAHLGTCSECRMVVAGTAGATREERSDARPFRRWLAVAAALIAVAIAIPAVRWSIGRHATVAHLINAAPSEHRLVEARLSGFEWAPLRHAARGGAQPDPADLKFTGAAGEVLEATAGAKTPEARRAHGDALLVIGRRAEAIAVLEQAATESRDGRTWNDLAAARYAMAVEEDRPSQLPLALEATDRALALDPEFAEARFNRALILERMGLLERARSAWHEYLAIDPKSSWSAEAREHLRALGVAGGPFDRKMLDSLPAAELVRRFPEEARTWSEGPLLAEWADGNEAKLARVRDIGSALAAANGERLLADAVTAIDAAQSAGIGGAAQKLAEGHRLYRDGRIALSRRDCAAAEAKLVQARAAFQKGSSPMRIMTSHFIAAAQFCRHQGDEAAGALGELRASMDANRYRAAAAQIDWSLAVAANGAGDWAAGARAADAASAAYRALGETTNAAVTDSIAAASLDLMGASDRAWARWIRAAAALDGPQHKARRGTMLRDAALALTHYSRHGAAASLLDLAVDDLGDDPAQLAAALTQRARTTAAQEDTIESARTLRAARFAAERVHDASLREAIVAPIDVADASLRRATDPRGAIAALDRAIGLFRAGNLNRFLPDAYLERARAHRAGGDASAAGRDYRAALAEVETQMARVDEANLRLRLMDTAAQVVEESIDLCLSRGDVAGAFAAADRTRELPGTVPSQPARGTAVVEYAVLPHRLVMFCLIDGTLTAKSVSMERAALARRVSAFAETIQRRAAIADVQAAAGALHRLLVAPHRQELARANRLVLVPDRHLSAIPFAALYDEARGQYLVEQYTLRIAPSATAVAADALPELAPALVVADPPGWNQRRLPVSREEGARIAAMHGATLLAGHDASRERFLSSIEHSSLVHYAGHADSDAGAYGALLLADGGQRNGMVSSAEISRLRLARNPLVVLAACSTFRGDITRAFLLAGARSVVGTLWEIDDDVAASLFLAFHLQLRRGAAPAAALRAAQLELLRGSNGKLAHPEAWAGVVVTERSERRTS